MSKEGRSCHSSPLPSVGEGPGVRGFWGAGELRNGLTLTRPRASRARPALSHRGRGMFDSMLCEG
jgi:hypothetical protein